MSSQPLSSPTHRSLYEDSTQHQHWHFSRIELEEKRVSLNTAAVDAIRSTFEAEDPGTSATIEFLTPEDELLLVKLYTSKIGPLCAHFRLPEVVEATACAYLRRFYLRNTVMDWHPKNVMLTAIFLATKTTNNPIPLETYASHIPKTTPAEVLELEFLVAQSLGFEFVVWHAHRALWGIYLDAQTLPSVPFKTIHEAYITAISHVRTSRLTDVELIYPPSQIALACLYAVAPGLAELWATTKGEQGVLSILPEINAMVRDQGAVPDLERVREIDKRLKICKNPEKIVGSKAYLKKQTEEEAKAREKRERKAAEVRGSEASRDPFGSDLAADTASSFAKQSLDEDDD